MPYTNSENKIDLNDYQKIKELTNGQTNQVSLWQHRHDKQLKIVVKEPNGINPDLLNHNLRAINAFFGEGSAWEVEGGRGERNAFAMIYVEGEKLSEDEIRQFISDKNSPIRTISKNGQLFTMLDPNEDNYLKLANGEIVPIDFDYMIMHDGQSLYEYQIQYLRGRQGFAIRVGDASCEEAAQYVIGSYPKAEEYLYQQWGKRYIPQKPRATAEEIVEPTPEWLGFSAKLELIKEKMSQFENKPNFKKAYDAAEKLYGRLKEEGDIYFKQPSSESYQQFKTNCQKEINEAHKELDQHRGWTKILVNILAFVLTLGAGYAIAAGVNMALNKGRFTFFATDSSSKLNAVEDYIESIGNTL